MRYVIWIEPVVNDGRLICRDTSRFKETPPLWSTITDASI